jgi:hypothetical protein
MFTVDFSYFDKETRRVCGSMYYFFEITIDETFHTETAAAQQKTFVDGLNSGCLDDELTEIAAPLIYEICPVQYSDIELATGTGAAVITNIVLTPSDADLLDEIRAAVLHNSPETEINVYYRNV